LPLPSPLRFARIKPNSKTTCLNGTEQALSEKVGRSKRENNADGFAAEQGSEVLTSPSSALALPRLREKNTAYKHNIANPSLNPVFMVFENIPPLIFWHWTQVVGLVFAICIPILQPFFMITIKAL
jgi:hypothetical protein